MKTNKFVKNFKKMSMSMKRHSPEILMISGIVGVVGSAIMACRATTKISGILEESKEKMDQIHTYISNNGISDEYTENDVKKDTYIVYGQTCFNLAKLYLPSIIIGALSLTSIVTSNKILRKRNVALASAYLAVDSGFKKYRSRVVERFGENTDKELRYGIKEKTIEEIEIDPETGKSKKVKKTIEVADENLASEYARYFDETSTEYQKDMTFNEYKIRASQSYANDLLKARGYLFLNEVYEMLGLPITKAGQIVGWCDDPYDDDSDTYVDFGMRQVYKETKNGYVPCIVLDFNVDGNILDKKFIK